MKRVSDLRYYRDMVKLMGTILFFWLYIPHLFAYFLCRSHKDIVLDLGAKNKHLRFPIHCHVLELLFWLHNDRYFRTWFYYRIGPAISLLISWYRPGDRHFMISNTTKIEGGCLFCHPYATVLNADSIGKNLIFRNLATIGDKDGKRATIGDNVTLGVNVTIIGDVKIGNNVFVGAGSVVVKDVPDNCVVAGNPAKVIKHL